MGFPGKVKFPIYSIILPGVTLHDLGELSVPSTTLREHPGV